ncbi:hypothetical protein DFH28DRAFT_253736 [Melampsora americana]|nr:hypothetical protein DFH28DRAFT_253736 [Melampsora americana]
MSNFKALIPRLRKTSLVYLPINFICVIGLIFVHTKIFSPNVPESFLLKLIAQNLKLIFPWAFIHSHALYSILDTDLLKEPSDSDKDIELGSLPSKPTPSVTPTPVEETPSTNPPPVSVPNDLGMSSYLIVFFLPLLSSILIIFLCFLHSFQVKVPQAAPTVLRSLPSPNLLTSTLVCFFHSFFF